MPDLVTGEAQLRVLLDNIPARVALLDREGRHCYINQEYIQFTGRPREMILGRSVTEIIGKAFEGFRGLRDRALAGEAVRWEGWMPHHDTGEPRFIQRFYVPYRGPEGSIDGYFTLTRDLTELKRVEQRLTEQVEALHASEALAAAITAAALDCVVVIDEAGHVVVFNDAAVDTFGYTRDEAVGRPISELIVPPGHRAAHVSGFRRYMAHGGSRLLGRRIEMEAMRADGSIFPAELTVTEVKLPERRLFAAYLRDLTAAKQAEAQIRRQREALHEVEKMAAFGSLLAGVAHELNNPLSIVIGYAVLLEEEAREQGAAAIADRAEKIRVAAERCGQTVRTFLAMARQRGRRRECIAVDRLLRSAFRLLEDRLAAEAIVVHWDVPETLPVVMGDPDQLHHVVANLVLNAQQALVGTVEHGCVTIAAAVRGSVFEISVADNGPGVPYAIRGRIFDPFFTTKNQGEGTGIGLAVSPGIAEAHGGTLTLDPSHQNGARFVLRLPLAEKPTGVAGPSADHLALGDFFWSPPHHETADKTVPRGP
jgi:two-component system NtrC family sensor kinase